MSLIKDLLQELQQYEEQKKTPGSLSDVAEAAQSERLNLTLPVGLMNQLKSHAIKEKRSCSSLASFLIEDGIRRHKALNID